MSVAQTLNKASYNFNLKQQDQRVKIGNPNVITEKIGIGVKIHRIQDPHCGGYHIKRSILPVWYDIITF
jgi:hypothetical protein